MIRLAAASLAVLAVAAFGATGSAHGAFPATKGRLVLVSEDEGFAFPSLVREDGSLLPLGLPLGIRGTVAMSADGTRLAMLDTVPFGLGLTPPTLLAGSLLDGISDLALGPVQGRPAWSPDGTRIAYAGNRNGNWDIYVVGTSTGAVPVDLTAGSPAADLEPRWSPDGTRIAFESDRGGDLDVYSMRPDGSGVVDLTGNAARDTLGDWSPDSKRLVFSSTRTGNGDLYLLPAAGGAATRLTSGSEVDSHAAWSPDGATIAYSSDVDGDDDVFEVASTGGAPARVTDNAHEDLVQDWQPLLDLSAPTARALTSRGVRGRALRFRFKVAENTGRAQVELTYSYPVAGGGVSGEASMSFRHARGDSVHVITLPPDAARGAPRSFRFCVQAADGSANIGKRSCARFHLLRKPKKRR